MIIVEELVDGIVQVTCRGTWDEAAWEETHDAVLHHTQDRTEPVYLLLNLSGIVCLDETGYRQLLVDPVLAQADMAILVVRRAHVKLARQLLADDPVQDGVEIRMMTHLKDAINTLLDRQAMSRVNGVNLYG